jgi:peptidyl-prolyl cis-trans isomerase D
LGDVSKLQLGAAGDGVFAMTEPGVAGPLPSDLGPALFRMNAVLAAQETTFDEAKESLGAEMRTDAARRAIDAPQRRDQRSPRLGRRLEEVAQEAGMEIATLDYVATDTPEGITAYSGFREAADALQEGDFPEAILLDEGALVALRLDEIVPPSPIPLEEVRADVVAAWTAEAQAKALAARAAEVKAEVEGGASLGAFGIVSVTRNITRDGFVEAAPETLLPTLFGMEAGALAVVEGDGFIGLLRLDEIIPAATTGEDAEALRDMIEIRARQALAQDAFQLFANALSNEAGIQLDQTAINAVHAQMN